MRIGISLSLDAACSQSAIPSTWASDFSGQTAGVLPAASLLALGSGGVVLTRASSATVQTSASTLDATPATNDPRVYFDGTVRGLLLEESRTNTCVQASALATSPWTKNASGTVTVADATGTGPDNVANSASRLVVGAINLNGVVQTMTGAAARVFSTWCRANTGTTSFQLLNGNGSAGSSAVGVSGMDTTWRRISTYGTCADLRVFVGETEDLTAYGGIATHTTDALSKFTQCEAGKFPTSAIQTTTVAVTRAGERLRNDTPSTLLVAGRLGLALSFYPLGASTEYSANMRLWTIDASNYAEVNFSTRVVTVIVGGVTRTLSALPTWSRLDLLEIWIAAGGGSSSTLAKARVNSGAVTDLGTGAAQAIIAPGGNALDFLCSGTASQFSAVVKSLSAMQPAWA